MNINDLKKDLAEEKRELKKNWGTLFVSELEKILEKCFFIHKNRKEHFVSKESLEVEIIKLLQSQKRFLPSDSIKVNLKNLGCYSKELNCICKINKIDFLNNKVNVLTIFKEEKELDFRDVEFFDFTTLSLIMFHQEQSKYFNEFSYNQVYNFLFDIKKEKVYEPPKYFTQP